MLVITPTDLTPAAKIGIRTFDEIAATYGAILEVDRLMVYTANGETAAHVDETYQDVPAGRSAGSGLCEDIAR